MPRQARRAATGRKAPGPGRPPIHTEAWGKVSVVLFDRQVQRLDRLARQSRRRGHKAINRAGIIRGLIDGMLMSGIDLSGHPTEAAVRDEIARRLRKS